MPKSVKYQHIYNPAKVGEKSIEEWEAFTKKHPTWVRYWKVVETFDSEPIQINIPAEAAEAKKKKKEAEETEMGS